jgi:hypothetical protein
LTGRIGVGNAILAPSVIAVGESFHHVDEMHLAGPMRSVGVLYGAKDHTVQLGDKSVKLDTQIGRHHDEAVSMNSVRSIRGEPVVKCGLVTIGRLLIEESRVASDI